VTQTVNTEQVKPSKDMLPNRSFRNSGQLGAGGRAMNFWPGMNTNFSNARAFANPSSGATR
jgi:hypothetical protein